MVARHQIGYRLSDSFHHAGAFMPQDDRQWQGKMGIPACDVRVADTACHYADEDFIGVRLTQGQPFDGQAAFGFAQHNGSDFHAKTLECAADPHILQTTQEVCPKPGGLINEFRVLDPLHELAEELL